MTSTHEIYEDLKESLKASKHQTISRQYIAGNGIVLIYALNRDTEKRAFYFIMNEASADSIPQCEGLSINKVRLYEYSPDDYYCQISQNAEAEGHIFEIIIEDIRKKADELSDAKKMAEMTSRLLLKWKAFFAQKKTVLLSAERQQGLYGELLFLRQLISSQGAPAMSYWCGCGYETHDFYIRGNAVEIKTTSTKAPYKMHISSEYQLDDVEITGDLFVYFYVLRKSSADGETLPDIVSDIRALLFESPMMYRKLNEDLEAYGYFDGLEDRYPTGYHIREEHAYTVKEGFPRIIKKMLREGIAACTYDISADCCAAFEVDHNDILPKTQGDETIG